MNHKPTAYLLLGAAVLTNVAFAALGSVFSYPDVLNEPAGEVLTTFRDSQTSVAAWFVVLAFSAALLAPIAIGVGRLSSHRAMRVAVGVGIAATSHHSSCRWSTPRPSSATSSGALGSSPSAS